MTQRLTRAVGDLRLIAEVNVRTARYEVAPRDHDLPGHHSPAADSALFCQHRSPSVDAGSLCSDRRVGSLRTDAGGALACIKAVLDQLPRPARPPVCPRLGSAARQGIGDRDDLALHATRRQWNRRARRTGQLETASRLIAVRDGQFTRLQRRRVGGRIPFDPIDDVAGLQRIRRVRGLRNHSGGRGARDRSCIDASPGTPLSASTNGSAAPNSENFIPCSLCVCSFLNGPCMTRGQCRHCGHAGHRRSHAHFSYPSGVERDLPC